MVNLIILFWFNSISRRIETDLRRKEMSRTEFAKKNVKFGLIARLLTLVINFITRTIFIRILGNQALGVNSLYTELLTMLSFAELGFASALVFAMYKPVADDDEEKVVKLLFF